MDMSIVRITSDTKFSDIEHHFRISAGPGAGKTHWLVSHIKNVLHNSKRLGNIRKIACITYTNIAVETIMTRLGTSSEQVEVSTIHSFLYEHIVKPYAHFVALDYGLNISKMDGHDENIISNYSFLKEWKKNTGQQRIIDDHLIENAFRIMKWKFDASMNLIVKTDYAHKINGYAIKKTSYFEYKRMAWNQGVIHHDDVLFFSYEIIRKYPFVLQVLRGKFPYFFVDEFQDSNPIQVEILKKIGQKGTIIGIIGDKAQSIYGFQGADVSQFSGFRFSNIKDYEMIDNRRSTNEIISFLNHIRKDFVQNNYRNETNGKPMLFVGDTILALREAQKLCVGGMVYSLSRENVTANAINKEIDGTVLNSKLIGEFEREDSNRERRRLIIACIKAVEFAREKKFKDAIKELQRVFGKNEDGKKKALKHLLVLVAEYEDYQDKTLMHFYDLVKSKVDTTLTKFSRGKIQDFYHNTDYKKISLCVNIPDGVSLNKTIHKAKGDEFENVLVVLKEEKDLEFILSPSLSNNEEHRVRYVAVSRAKERLFISIPTLEEDVRSRVDIDAVLNIKDLL